MFTFDFDSVKTNIMSYRTRFVPMITDNALFSGSHWFSSALGYQNEKLCISFQYKLGQVFLICYFLVLQRQTSKSEENNTVCLESDSSNNKTHKLTVNTVKVLISFSRMVWMLHVWTVQDEDDGNKFDRKNHFRLKNGNYKINKRNVHRKKKKWNDLKLITSSKKVILASCLCFFRPVAGLDQIQRACKSRRLSASQSFIWIMKSLNAKRRSQANVQHSNWPYA